MSCSRIVRPSPPLPVVVVALDIFWCCVFSIDLDGDRLSLLSGALLAFGLAARFFFGLSSLFAFFGDLLRCFWSLPRFSERPRFMRFSDRLLRSLGMDLRDLSLLVLLDLESRSLLDLACLADEDLLRCLPSCFGFSESSFFCCVAFSS